VPSLLSFLCVINTIVVFNGLRERRFTARSNTPRTPSCRHSLTPLFCLTISPLVIDSRRFVSQPAQTGVRTAKGESSCFWCTVFAVRLLSDKQPQSSPEISSSAFLRRPFYLSGVLTSSPGDSGRLWWLLHRRFPVLLPLAVVLSLFGTWTLGSSGAYEFLVENRKQVRGEPALPARIVTPRNLRSSLRESPFVRVRSFRRFFVIGEITCKSRRRLSSCRNEGKPLRLKGRSLTHHL